MALRCQLATLTYRGLVHTSRRCRTSKSIPRSSISRGYSFSSRSAHKRVTPLVGGVPSRSPPVPILLSTTHGNTRGVFDGDCYREQSRGQMRSLSTEPVQGGDREGASAGEEKVFIRGGGEFGTDGDPGPPPPLDPSIVTGPSEKVLKVMADIEALDLIEVTMLIEAFKDKMGLDEIPSLNFGGEVGQNGGKASGGAGTGAGEKTLFSVNVTGFNDKSKIKVIKEIRAITGLGLREAKAFVDNLPKVIKADLKKEEAEKITEALKAAGAIAAVE